MMSLELASYHLQQTLSLAQKGRGFCAPNPAVGAVIVKQRRVIATGYHQGAGKPHAEAEALSQLSLEQSTGATIYISLEPCCHQGRTPPCTVLLIERGIKAVYYGYNDPNPLVAGKSKQLLQAAGIECTHLALASIDAFYQSYHYWVMTQRPWVAAKLALSLDGKIAGPSGERVLITGKEAQRFTHLHRQQSDAILTTIKTILNDDPQLNVRLGGQPQPKPLYILDTQLALPTNAQLFKHAASVTVFHQPQVDNARKQRLESHGVRCVPTSLNDGRINLDQALACIGQDGVHDIWVEAGGTCFAALLAENKLQRAFIIVAPKWLGANAQSAFTSSSAAFVFNQEITWRALGQDAVCEINLTNHPLCDKPTSTN